MKWTPNVGEPKSPKGIRRTATGWRVYGRAGGQFFSKSFPAETSLKALKDWRQERRVTIRARQLGVEQDRPLPTLPREDWRRLTPSADGWCYVYFVQAGDRIKIGRATDLGRRVRTLQTAHHEDLALILSIPAHAALEAAIQQRFDHLKTRGEWFRAAPDLVAFIDAVKSGANPVALLW